MTRAETDWATRRMLQALDAYWLHCDGLPKGRYPRGRWDDEAWWGRYEKYRAIVEDAYNQPEEVMLG